MSYECINCFHPRRRKGNEIAENGLLSSGMFWKKLHTFEQKIGNAEDDNYIFKTRCESCQLQNNCSLVNEKVKEHGNFRKIPFKINNVKQNEQCPTQTRFNTHKPQASSQKENLTEASTSFCIDETISKFPCVKNLIDHFNVISLSNQRVSCSNSNSAKENTKCQNNKYTFPSIIMTNTTVPGSQTIKPCCLTVPHLMLQKSLSCSNLLRIDSLSSDEGYVRDKTDSSPSTPSPTEPLISSDFLCSQRDSAIDIPVLKSFSCVNLSSTSHYQIDNSICKNKRSNSSDSALILRNEDEKNAADSLTFLQQQTVPTINIDQSECPPQTCQKLTSFPLQAPSVIISDHSSEEKFSVTELSSNPVSFSSKGLTLEDIGRQWNIPLRKYSNSSTCSTLSFDDDDYRSGEETCSSTSEHKSSGWRKVRNIVHWSPFIQTYKKQKYPWIQLAGHQGSFKAGDHGTILKKLCPKEEKCLQKLSSDVLRPYIPEYKGQVEGEEGEKYIRMQDLLVDFENPCVMDCKMGVRTYLEEELAKAKEKPKLRKDMYEKMIQIDSGAPTSEENLLKGITKPRYMVWRETISSTATLGFRIEGMKKGDGTSSKDFKTTKTKEQVLDAFRGFIKDYPRTARAYVQRLKAIRATLDVSEFFANYELIGSSLLFVHNHAKANVWMIDFAKTLPLPEGVKIDHHSPWVVGSHEDGYLIGLENLIDLFEILALEEPSSETNEPAL